VNWVAFIAIVAAGFIGASIVRGSDLKGVAAIVVPLVFVLGACGLGVLLGVNPVKIMAWAGVVVIAVVAWAVFAPDKKAKVPSGEA
jgi:uncharacterized membrane protein